MEIYLIRHTTPLVEKGICYGQSDIPLAGTFEAEWIAIQQTLPKTIDCLYTSPLTRCLQLAKKLEQHYKVPLLPDKRLMEMDFGEWEMKAWNNIEKQDLEKWMSNYVEEKCPSGESYTAVLLRVEEFINTLKKHSYNKVLIVTHGGVIKSFYSIIEGISPQQAMGKQVRYGEVCCFII
jgi:alpha-ribazole phosphatase